ncbi:uncharacterized protein LOC114580831 [Dendrobium catenatum]|uniref:uncharacterized protein LOC114580831 n=1 Tax=Dendrobium catenatum TaxID=906689 RepID=UPI00109F9921|nr:uncharacterized protein LOC114580831 [Dendrobium catenatum]
MTNLQNINTSEQSLGEVKYYSTRVVIKGLNQEGNLWYLIKLRVEDISSTAIFTVFDNEVEQLIGMPVTNLEKIKASNIEDYNNIITNICDKELIFSVKVQDKEYGNRSFRSITVQSIKEISDEVIETEPKKIKLEDL